MDKDDTDNSKSIESYLYWTASKCTDPVCYVHETIWRYRLIDSLPKNSRPLSSNFSMITSPSKTFLSIPGAAVGTVFRWIAAALQDEPYIYTKSKKEDKLLPEKKQISHLLWNICCVGAGYSITEGGVVPWKERIDRIAEQIIETDADVNSIYETFDIDSAFYLSEKLSSKGYHCFYNIGPNIVGTSSGIFVASKYKVVNAKFTPFSKDTLLGRTKNCKKGVFQFDLTSDGKTFAPVLSTHLQHSEKPEFPTNEEVLSREKQMQAMLEITKKLPPHCILVNGDLNLDDREFENSSWKDLFEKGKIHGTEKTWGGDAFCASLMNKEASKPLNLDHAMIIKGSARSISSKIISSKFDGTTFKKEALSDHNRVLTIIEIS